MTKFLLACKPLSRTREDPMPLIPASTSRFGNWRTRGVIIFAGCVVALLAFGPRATMGFFLQPMSRENGWGRDVFALAFAIQNLLWGVGQPFAGAVADRFGA